MGGFILADVNSREALEDILQGDPFHAKNLADYEILEIAPNKADARLEFLLAT